MHATRVEWNSPEPKHGAPLDRCRPRRRLLTAVPKGPKLHRPPNSMIAALHEARLLRAESSGEAQPILRQVQVHRDLLTDVSLRAKCSKPKCSKALHCSNDLMSAEHSTCFFWPNIQVGLCFLWVPLGLFHRTKQGKPWESKGHSGFGTPCSGLLVSLLLHGKLLIQP